MRKQILLFCQNHFSGRIFESQKQPGLFNMLRFKLKQRNLFKKLQIYDSKIDHNYLSTKIGSQLLQLSQAKQNQDKVEFFKVLTAPKAYEFFENDNQNIEIFQNLVDVKVKEIQFFEAKNFNWVQIQFEAILANQKYESKEVIAEKNLDQNTNWKICYINQIQICLYVFFELCKQFNYYLAKLKKLKILSPSLKGFFKNLEEHNIDSTF